MKNWRAVLTLIAALAWSCTALGQEPGRDLDTVHSLRISRFEIHGQSVLHALLRLGEQTRVPFGVVEMDSRLCTTNVELSVQDQPISAALDGITRQVEGYRWHSRNGVVTVEPATPSAPIQQFLHIVIDRYATPETNENGLAVFLWGDVRATLRPDVGTAASILQSPAEPTVRLDMRNATVEEILNRIAFEVGGAWVLQPVPSDMKARAVAEKPLFVVVAYAKGINDALQQSCLPAS